MIRFHSIVVAAGCFVLYVATLAPTFLWSDSAKLAIFVQERQFAGASFGLHPLHSVLGYLFSFLPFSLAYTQNLMSAFFAALAVFFVCRIVQVETRDPYAAVLSGSALGVSHLFWMYGVINETYSLVAFFYAVIFYVGWHWLHRPREWLLFLTAFLLGAAFSNHAMTFLMIPGLLVLFWGPELRSFVMSPVRFTLATVVFALGGFTVFLLPLFYGSSSVPELLREFGSTTGEHLRQYTPGPKKMLGEILRYPLYLAYQFPSLALFVAPFALKHRSRFQLALLITWLAVVLFAVQYFLQRQFPMLIPSFLIFSIWIGIGAGALALPRSKMLFLFFLTICLPPLVYYAAYRLAPMDLSFIRPLPYRNTARYYLFPAKHFERGAEEYAFDAFSQADRGAVILSDFNPGMALVYGQKVLGMRRDLTIDVRIDEWIHSDPQHAGAKIQEYLRQKTAGSTVYLADIYEPYYFVSSIRKDFDLEQKGGPLWKVIPKSSQEPRSEDPRSP